MEGWIKLHRCIMDNYLYTAEPFDRLHAWIDILLNCNHDFQKMMLDGKVIAVDEGEWITSFSKLSKRWGWSRCKVTNFVRTLESDNMIHINSTGKYIAVIVDNYAKYQSKFEPLTTGNRQVIVQENNRITTGKQQEKDTNKNIKNDKNIKRNEIFVDTNVSTHISQRENPPESEGSHLSYVEIVEEYNAICKDLPKVKLLTDARKQQLRVCSNLLKEAGVDFKGYFAKVQQSDFLTGRNDSKRKWRADFDWICKKGNCTKILEGVYDNRKDTNKWCEY